MSYSVRYLVEHIDPELGTVLVPATIGGKLFDMYRERVRRLACGFPLDDNYFAWQAFGRRYDHDGRRALPDYLNPEDEGLGRIMTDVRAPKVDVFFVYPEELRNSKRVAVFRDFLLAKLSEKG